MLGATAEKCQEPFSEKQGLTNFDPKPEWNRFFSERKNGSGMKTIVPFSLGGRFRGGQDWTILHQRTKGGLNINLVLLLPDQCIYLPPEKNPFVLKWTD